MTSSVDTGPETPTLTLPWQVHVITLFPQMFPGPLGQSLAGRGLDKGIWNLNTVNLRDFGIGPHQTVDDAPFGGGVGMVIRPDVVDAALTAVVGENNPRHVPIIHFSPRGKPLTQDSVKSLTEAQELVLVCGRYEGIDCRVIESWKMTEISLGDFVLSGGEPAALAVLDACVRLLPGVMNKAASADEESFSNGLLEYPHYTRPQGWKGGDVPDVLMSGHHGEIQRWRQAQGEEVTRHRRPDLWETYCSTVLKQKGS